MGHTINTVSILLVWHEDEGFGQTLQEKAVDL
jgi:hypothetical protein